MLSNKKDTLKNRLYHWTGLSFLNDRIQSAWAYISVYVWAFQATVQESVEDLVRTIRWWWERRQRRKEAYEELAKQMGTYREGRKSAMDALPEDTDDSAFDQESNARDSAAERVARAAYKAAQKAPTGSLSEKKVVEAIKSESSADEPDPVGIRSVPDPTRKEKSQSTPRNVVASFNDSTINPLEDADFEDRITVSSNEKHQADLEHMSDTVVPPPYRSDIKTTDLNVRGYWEQNPNAIEEVQEANRHPIVNRRISKTVEHLTTSGAKIAGPPKQVEVIRKWFEVDLEYSTGYKKGLNRYIEDLSQQMLKYGTGVVFKQRTRSDLLEPYEDPLSGAQRSPVQGYGIPDMSTVEAFIDKKGRPRKWRQDTTLWTGAQNAKEYRDRDVFMARLPIRNSSMYFWTPSLVMPVLYSVEVLKDLHDTIESHSQNIVDIPSYAKVGSKDYIDGKVTPSMLDKVAQTIRSTARGMMLILPWHVDLEKHESDEYTEELVNVANFWEKITRRGIGGNQFDDGDGGTANRRTADVLVEGDMRLAQAMVPEIQRSARWLFVDKLLEKGFELEEIMSQDEMVGIVFEDIDLSKQMAREGHIVFKFQNDGLTHGEYRHALGEDPDPDRADMYYSEIQKEIQEELDAKKAEAQSRNRPNGNPKPKRKNDHYPDNVDDEPIV